MTLEQVQNIFSLSTFDSVILRHARSEESPRYDVTFILYPENYRQYVLILYPIEYVLKPSSIIEL